MRAYCPNSISLPSQSILTFFPPSPPILHSTPLPFLFVLGSSELLLVIRTQLYFPCKEGLFMRLYYAERRLVMSVIGWPPGHNK